MRMGGAVPSGGLLSLCRVAEPEPKLLLICHDHLHVVSAPHVHLQTLDLVLWMVLGGLSALLCGAQIYNYLA